MHDLWEQLNDPHYTGLPASLGVMLDCGSDSDDCWGPGPPPEFRLPPPPRPPFLQELPGLKCTEEPLPDIEMCSVLPAILDPSFHISPSQTSTLIFVCSVLLVFTVCLSSFVVWKHKRKVPGFLQCKTPTRQLGTQRSRHGSPDGSSSGGGGTGTGSRQRNMMHHAVAVGASLYEDPDLHIGPMVLRQHQHQHQQQQHHLLLNNGSGAGEALLPKSVHYPSGYPMPHSPPIFVCSSPGPDPYRSHDNVYEELDQQQQQQQQLQHQQQQQQHPTPTRRNSDAPTLPLSGDHDADADAEDELSLTGCTADPASYPKHLYQQPLQLHQQPPISTIYHERQRSTGDLLDRSTASERHSLLSTSSSSGTGPSLARACLPNTLFGSATSRSQRQQQQQPPQRHHYHHQHHTQPRHQHHQHHSHVLPPPSYEVLQLPPVQHQQPAYHTRTFDRSSPRFYRHPANSTAHILNAAPAGWHSGPRSATAGHHRLPVGSFAAALQHDVEVKRRNQLNTHLTHQATTSAGISTIYQTADPRLDQQQQLQQSRARTNPRPADRRRQHQQQHQQQPAPQQVYTPTHVPASASMYGTYREPIASRSGVDGDFYQHAGTLRGSQYPSYISPAEFSTFRQFTAANGGQQSTPPAAPSAAPEAAPTTVVLNPITSRDSSFGSDSGYSHHTQNSSNHLVGLLAQCSEVPATTAAHIQTAESS